MQANVVVVVVRIGTDLSRYEIILFLVLCILYYIRLRYV